jgi:hypothetical protein
MSKNQNRRDAAIDRHHDHVNGWADCPYCESPFHIYRGHVDHIKPSAKGGQDWKSNLILVCPSCNRKKDNLPLSVFCYLQGFTPESVYLRLKKQGKSIPSDMLDLLGYDD